jgi:hypothetical protein
VIAKMAATGTAATAEAMRATERAVPSLRPDPGITTVKITLARLRVFRRGQENRGRENLARAAV